MITVDNVSFSYINDQNCINNVSFSVANGSITGIIGPNGAGKSTLLRLLLKQLAPSSGMITMDNKPLSDWTTKDLSRHMAWMSAEPFPPFHFTVNAILAMGRYPFVGLSGQLSKVDREIVESVAEELNLTRFLDRPVHRLSSGEQQLVQLGRALVQTPKILVLDEPVSHLDMGYQCLFCKWIRAKADAGMTVVVVSHHVHLLQGLCDQVVLLKQGAVFAQGESSLLAGDIARELFEIAIDF